MTGSNKTLGDSFAVTINFKWLLQIIVITAVAVYAFWTIEGRIQALERNMEFAISEIELHNQERIAMQKAAKEELQAENNLLKTELNINPFSWGKKKK